MKKSDIVATWLAQAGARTVVEGGPAPADQPRYVPESVNPGVGDALKARHDRHVARLPQDGLVAGVEVS